MEINKYINILSMAFLIISIIMFEIGYKKQKKRIFINGVEFMAFAITTILAKYIPKAFEITIINYIQLILCSFISYYIVKILIMYTVKKQKQLRDLSDIKDIVKNEPIKKETKRKNKKVEEVK